MASKNEITGKEIKSAPASKAYAEGWERIFAKKSSNSWLEESGIILASSEGWNLNDGVDLETPIKYSDFKKRLSLSKVRE